MSLYQRHEEQKSKLPSLVSSLQLFIILFLLFTLTACTPEIIIVKKTTTSDTGYLTDTENPTGCEGDCTTGMYGAGTT